MKTRGRTAVAVALVLSAAVLPQARAEEIFRSTQGVKCVPNGGCAQFQGYIYVRREHETAPAPVLRPTGPGNAQLGERRLYLGAAETR